MTRKLIIGCLQSIIDIYEMSKNEKPWANVPIDSEDVEAIRLSIEKWGEQNAGPCEDASSSENPNKCEDAINRQAAIDTLDNTDKFMDEDRTVETYKALLKECYEVLPPVTPKQKTGLWIPVSERLPEEEGRYLATIFNGIRYIMTCTYFPRGCMWNPDDECASDNVIAWMPLPEPYKAESEDTE